MVILTFLPDEAALADDEADLASGQKTTDLSADILLLLCFAMPIRFTVGGVEVFGGMAAADVWSGPLPILGVVNGFLIALREARRTGSHAFRYWQASLEIVFSRVEDGEVKVDLRLINGPQEGPAGKAPFAEVEAACLQFGDEVRRVLLARFPDFRTHTELGAWFRSEVDRPLP